MCRWVLSGLHNVKLPVFIYGNLLTELLKIIIVNIKLSRTRRDSHMRTYIRVTDDVRIKNFFLYTEHHVDGTIFVYYYSG